MNLSDTESCSSMVALISLGTNSAMDEPNGLKWCSSTAVYTYERFFLLGSRHEKVANRPCRRGSTVNEPAVGFIAARY